MAGKTDDMTCICGSKNITTHHDVGSDINSSGEERQHADSCKDCGAWRFHMDFISFNEDEAKSGTYYGPWEEKNDEGYDFIKYLPI